jgi:hypothetical protein
MADEKKQNPFEGMGPSEEADHPPAYTTGPSTSSPGPAPGPAPDLPQGRKPVALPAISSSFDSPFIRAYPPILQSHNLPKESFLFFLDQLNKDISSSPPLQVLDVTGGILNSVPILFPLHWIGNVVSGLATLGSQGVSKSRTDSFLKTANKDIFGPRGLKVEITKLDALAHLAKIPILDAQGKINRQAPLFLQLRDEAVVGDERQVEMELQRRIRTLGPWIEDLEVEVLPWSSKSKLTRLNAALKKRNAPRDTRDGERRGRDGSYDAEVRQEENESFRKALWLVIREIEEGRR